MPEYRILWEWEVLRYLIFPLIVGFAVYLISWLLGKKRWVKESSRQKETVKELSKQQELYKDMNMKLFQEIIISGQKIKQHLLASTGFRKFTTSQTDNLHKAFLSTDQFSFKEMTALIDTKIAIKQALATICKIASAVFCKELSHFSCTIMLPDKTRHTLRITDFFNSRDEYPRTYGRPDYGYKTSCAGYAWYQWEELIGERFFVLPNVPQHVNKYDEKDPGRKFEVKHREQVDKYKSIISVILYHQLEQDRFMLGVLNIASDIEGLFTREEYKDKLELPLLPSHQTLVLSYMTNQIIAKYSSS